MRQCVYLFKRFVSTGCRNVARVVTVVGVCTASHVVVHRGHPIRVMKPPFIIAIASGLQCIGEHHSSSPHRSVVCIVAVDDTSSTFTISTPVIVALAVHAVGVVIVVKLLTVTIAPLIFLAHSCCQRTVVTPRCVARLLWVPCRRHQLSTRTRGRRKSVAMGWPTWVVGMQPVSHKVG